MTAEDKCRFCKDLIRWSKTPFVDVRYLEERIYAVSFHGAVLLLEASNPSEAYDKAKAMLRPAVNPDA